MGWELLTMAPGWLVPAVTINQPATFAVQPLLFFYPGISFNVLYLEKKITT